MKASSSGGNAGSFFPGDMRRLIQHDHSGMLERILSGLPGYLKREPLARLNSLYGCFSNGFERPLLPQARKRSLP